MSDHRPRLTIVIPAYNEHDRIVTTLEHSIDYLKRQPFQSELIVVSDGSTDPTAQVVRSFQSAAAQVKIEMLEYFPNRGKGYAVRYGMLRARGRCVLFMDADYAVPIEAVEPALAALDSGYDVAIASRAIDGAQVTAHQNFFREMSAKVYTFIQNHYLGISYPDTQCGFKLFTRPCAQALFSRQRLNSVIFDPEILWMAQKMGFSVAQFPVKWTHIADSRIQYDSIGKSVFIFSELFRIKKLHRNDTW